MGKFLLVVLIKMLSLHCFPFVIRRIQLLQKISNRNTFFDLNYQIPHENVIGNLFPHFWAIFDYFSLLTMITYFPYNYLPLKHSYVEK